MIVKDKKAVIEYADKTVFEMINIMSEKSKNYSGDDDGVELIYFVMHISAIFKAKMIILLEKYSSIFGIETDFNDVINDISAEYYKAFVKHIDDTTH